MLAGLVSGVLVARLLGPEGRGLIGTVVTYTTVLVSFSHLMIGDTAVMEKKTASLETVLSHSWSLAVINFIIATPMFALFAYVLFLQYESIPQLLTIIYFIFFSLTNMMYQLYFGVLRIQGQFWKLQVFALAKPAIYAIFLALLALGFGPATVENVLLCLIASDFLATVFMVALSGIPFRGKFNPRESWQFAKSGLPIYAAKVIQLLGGQGDRLLVVLLLAPYEIGIYLVALTFATVLPGIYSTAIKLLVFPAAANMPEDTRGKQVLEMLRLTWLASLIATLVTILVSQPLIPLVFGSPFAGSVVLAIALAAAGILRPVSDSLLEVQKSYQVTRFFAVPSAVLFLSFVFVSLLLFRWLGVYAFVAGRAVSECVTVAILSRRLSQHAPEISVWRWIVPRWEDFRKLSTLSWGVVSGVRPR